MLEFALWWCSGEAIDIILRYVLVALVWLVLLLVNRKRRSRIIWAVLWLWGFASLILAAIPYWQYHSGEVVTSGIAGVGRAVVVLFGFIAGAVYLIMLAWTIGFTFTKKD